MKEPKARLAVRFKSDAEAEKYIGKYVAIPSFTRNRVIRYETGEPVAGQNPTDVIRQAKKLGHDHPVLIWIPKYTCYYILAVKKCA